MAGLLYPCGFFILKVHATFQFTTPAYSLPSTNFDTWLHHFFFIAAYFPEPLQHSSVVKFAFLHLETENHLQALLIKMIRKYLNR